MSLPQFSGESPYDAILNRYSMDLEEEDAFRSYLEAQGLTPETATPAQLEAAVTAWHAELHRQDKYDGTEGSER